MDASSETSPARVVGGFAWFWVGGAASLILRFRSAWSGVPSLAMPDEFRGRPVLDLRVWVGDWGVICRGVAC